MHNFHKSFSTALILCLLMPSLAAAQRTGDLRGRKPRTNFYRQIGGSCIYDKDGKLSYAPEGTDCRRKQDPAAGGNIERVSPQLEIELDRYRQEHAEMNEAFAELRESIDDREYKQATKLLDRSRTKILSHKRREEKLYDRLITAPPASPDPASDETALE